VPWLKKLELSYSFYTSYHTSYLVSDLVVHPEELLDAQNIARVLRHYITRYNR